MLQYTPIQHNNKKRKIFKKRCNRLLLPLLSMSLGDAATGPRHRACIMSFGLSASKL
jgi:hypothetical protein